MSLYPDNIRGWPDPNGPMDPMQTDVVFAHNMQMVVSLARKDPNRLDDGPDCRLQHESIALLMPNKIYPGQEHQFTAVGVEDFCLDDIKNGLYGDITRLRMGGVVHGMNPNKRASDYHLTQNISWGRKGEHDIRDYFKGVSIAPGDFLGFVFLVNIDKETGETVGLAKFVWSITERWPVSIATLNEQTDLHSFITLFDHIRRRLKSILDPNKPDSAEYKAQFKGFDFSNVIYDEKEVPKTDDDGNVVGEGYNRNIETRYIIMSIGKVVAFNVSYASNTDIAPLIPAPSFYSAAHSDSNMLKVDIELASVIAGIVPAAPRVQQLLSTSVDPYIHPELHEKLTLHWYQFVPIGLTETDTYTGDPSETNINISFDVMCGVQPFIVETRFWEQDPKSTYWYRTFADRGDVSLARYVAKEVDGSDVKSIKFEPELNIETDPSDGWYIDATKAPEVYEKVLEEVQRSLCSSSKHLVITKLVTDNLYANNRCANWFYSSLPQAMEYEPSLMNSPPPPTESDGKEDGDTDSSELEALQRTADKLMVDLNTAADELANLLRNVTNFDSLLPDGMSTFPSWTKAIQPNLTQFRTRSNQLIQDVQAYIDNHDDKTNPKALLDSVSASSAAMLSLSDTESSLYKYVKAAYESRETFNVLNDKYGSKEPTDTSSIRLSTDLETAEQFSTKLSATQPTTDDMKNFAFWKQYHDKGNLFEITVHSNYDTRWGKLRTTIQDRLNKLLTDTEFLKRLNDQLTEFEKALNFVREKSALFLEGIKRETPRLQVNAFAIDNRGEINRLYESSQKEFKSRPTIPEDNATRQKLERVFREWNAWTGYLPHYFDLLQKLGEILLNERDPDNAADATKISADIAALISNVNKIRNESSFSTNLENLKIPITLALADERTTTLVNRAEQVASHLTDVDYWLRTINESIALLGSAFKINNQTVLTSGDGAVKDLTYSIGTINKTLETQAFRKVQTRLQTLEVVKSLMEYAQTSYIPTLKNIRNLVDSLKAYNSSDSAVTQDAVDTFKADLAVREALSTKLKGELTISRSKVSQNQLLSHLDKTLSDSISDIDATYKGMNALLTTISKKLPGAQKEPPKDGGGPKGADGLPGAEIPASTTAISELPHIKFLTGESFSFLDTQKSNDRLKRFPDPTSPNFDRRLFALRAFPALYTSPDPDKLFESVKESITNSAVQAAYSTAFRGKPGFLRLVRHGELPQNALVVSYLPGEGGTFSYYGGQSDAKLQFHPTVSLFVTPLTIPAKKVKKSSNPAFAAAIKKYLGSLADQLETAGYKDQAESVKRRINLV